MFIKSLSGKWNSIQLVPKKRKKAVKEIYWYRLWVPRTWWSSGHLIVPHSLLLQPVD